MVVADVLDVEPSTYAQPAVTAEKIKQPVTTSQLCASSHEGFQSSTGAASFCFARDSIAGSAFVEELEVEGNFSLSSGSCVDLSILAGEGVYEVVMRGGNWEHCRRRREESEDTIRTGS